MSAPPDPQTAIVGSTSKGMGRGKGGRGGGREGEGERKGKGGRGGEEGKEKGAPHFLLTTLTIE